jgi:hypothetical protein
MKSVSAGVSAGAITQKLRCVCKCLQNNSWGEGGACTAQENTSQPNVWSEHCQKWCFLKMESDKIQQFLTSVSVCCFVNPGRLILRSPSLVKSQQDRKVNASFSAATKKFVKHQGWPQLWLSPAQDTASKGLKQPLCTVKKRLLTLQKLIWVSPKAPF